MNIFSKLLAGSLNIITSQSDYRRVKMKMEEDLWLTRQVGMGRDEVPEEQTKSYTLPVTSLSNHTIHSYMHTCLL